MRRSSTRGMHHHGRAPARSGVQAATSIAAALAAGIVVLATPAAPALANCQDLLNSSVYDCHVKRDDGDRFSDCFRFSSPGELSEDFDLSVDGFPNVLGCDCKAGGDFASPGFGESNAFQCVSVILEDDVPPFGLAFDGTVRQQGHRIRAEGVNDFGTSFILRCERVASCEVPAAPQSKGATTWQ
jgi:hypothetical protein